MNWDDNIKAFWSGTNGNEYIAWKGSHQILIYPCDNYPNPPSGVIQYNKRIEILEDFEDAMRTGEEFKCSYIKK
ncbi:hypothetical protein COE51_19470 [Bacillus pseudomycoides]|nr:hypothetical protein COE51_19470 [Bacillus pseudomycoides]